MIAKKYRELYIHIEKINNKTVFCKVEKVMSVVSLDFTNEKRKTK